MSAGLDLEWTGGPLAVLARRRLADHGLEGPVPLAGLWGPAFFGLDRVAAYTDASDEARHAILADCARAQLMEAYFIEKAGVSYAAKMTLLAESADERSLYALFAADEVAHLDAIRAALGPVDESAWQADPFLRLLERIVADADRHTSQLVIQVVLEGWGLVHYAALRDACTHPALTALLTRILADEAGHHGSGVHLLREVRLPASGPAVELLSEMLAMVQAGPARVVSALERHTGGLTRAQRLRVLEELDAEGHVRQRLTRLRGCLDKVSGARPVTEALAARGRFAVPTLEALA